MPQHIAISTDSTSLNNMKHLFFVICLLVCFPTTVFGGTCWNGGSSGSSPWSVLDGSGGSPSVAYVDVKYCVETVADTGETVNIPAGTVDWSTSYLSVSKAIKIVGAGVANTIITSSGTYTIKIDTGAAATTFAFEVSGIRFNSTSTYIIHASGGGSGWRIHDNYFNNTGATTTVIYGVYLVNMNTTGNAYNLFGLIDTNAFYHAKVNEDASVNAAESSWAAASAIGTANATFIENNTFSQFDTCNNTYNSVDSNGGARLVIRYNDFNDARIESHSACDTNVRGTRSYEIYNNHIKGTCPANASDTTYGWTPTIRLRAGTNIVTRNKVAGNWRTDTGLGGPYVDDRRASEDCTGYGLCDGVTTTYDTTGLSPAHNITATEDKNVLCLDQVGAGTGAMNSQTLDPTYIWDNVSGKICRGGANKYLVCAVDGDCPESTCAETANTPNTATIHAGSIHSIKINRDYYEGEKSGYKSYDCPHPLNTDKPNSTYTCDSAQYGTGGYATAKTAANHSFSGGATHKWGSGSTSTWQ